MWLFLSFRYGAEVKTLFLKRLAFDTSLPQAESSILKCDSSPRRFRSGLSGVAPAFPVNKSNTTQMII